MPRTAQKRAEPEPLSVDHLRLWIKQNELTLEDDSPWELEPFQAELASDIFSGWREVWAIIPEGNAKTTFFAGIALYLEDHCRSPWIPIGAASRDQAEILFGQAGGFIERSKSLKARFRVYEGYRRIKHRVNGGKGIKVYAADAGTGDGVIPYPISLIDEPHRHKDMSLYRLWKGKSWKRGAQIAALSTAGEPNSEFENMREAIRQRAIDRRYEGQCHLRAEGKNLVYHEWMVPKVELADDLEVVKAANPLKHITIDALREKRESETLDYGTDWLRLTCNIPTRSTLAAIPEKDWDELETEEQIPEGVPIMAGADFAFLEDTTAITPHWPRTDGPRLFGDPAILEPPHNGMLDINEVKHAFLEMHERNPLEVVILDPSKAQDIAQWLSDELGALVVMRSQKTEFAVADYENWMAAMRAKAFRHTGSPDFRRHVLDAIRARVPGDKYRFDRPRTIRKAGADKRHIVIDALTAAAMVNTHAMDALAGTVYDDRGALVI